MTTVNSAAAVAAPTPRTDITVRAYFLGQSIDLRAIAQQRQIQAPLPALLMVSIGEPGGEEGQGVLLSYGAVVLFGLSEAAERGFIATLAPYIQAPFEQPETEAATIRLAEISSGKVQDGLIFLSSLDDLRLQLVADVMAKSVVLAHYEIGAAAVFDRIEPYAAELQHQRQIRVRGDQLLKQIGQTLTIQHKIVGRVEIIDKPELLWEYPELDLLYQRLEDEYEIRDRHSALERKLDLVSRTAETVLDLQRQQTGLRLEWYVVLLIVIEVLLSLYDLFIRPR
ncbi:RMD1 family protein [Nodosilinea sp. LEGE 06152]|uniref:RMD1 family protein n=1 Tax=Nodosilinea sp. LEGE 06152 TaxID=2777966 RepID=UPI001881618D|nr:RMD1 family protein [Nodosilinea sp. LEGE 06152]MBE9156669.1 RMD1 family protein [Nodosilinea sp. LEGE 06152]